MFDKVIEKALRKIQKEKDLRSRRSMVTGPKLTSLEPTQPTFPRGFESWSLTYFIMSGVFDELVTVAVEFAMIMGGLEEVAKIIRELAFKFEAEGMEQDTQTIQEYINEALSEGGSHA